jgi:hypothetical protein
MPRRFKQQVRGFAEPVLIREPLLVRSCTAFVNNLTRIYQRPQAKPDDIGNIPYDVRHLYADAPPRNIIYDDLIAL